MQIDIAKISKKKSSKSWIANFQPLLSNVFLVSYIIERLPEGGEGAHGYDDGEGDDWVFPEILLLFGFALCKFLQLTTML